MATPKKKSVKKSAAKKSPAKKAAKKAPKKSLDAISEDTRAMIETLREQNRRLLAQVELATEAQAHSQEQLAATMPKNTAVGSTLMVGIRSRADTTLGIAGEFGEKDLQLFPDTGPTATGTTAIVSYAWWRSLRASEWTRRGLIERDDSVLGNTFRAGPPDDAADLPAEHYINLIVDPKQWIESRTEDEIEADIDRITSEESLHRLRGVVDRELVRLESKHPRETVKQQETAARKAMSQLSGKLRKVDDLTTRKIEKRDEPVGEHDQYAGPLRVW